MLVIDFLEILGCSLVAFSIVVVIFEKGGKGGNQVHIR